MSIEHDLKTKETEESRFNRFYEKNYNESLQLIKENYRIFDGVMLDYFSEEFGEWDEEDLRALHKAFNEKLYFPAGENERLFYDKWLEECHDETDRWLKEIGE